MRGRKSILTVGLLVGFGLLVVPLTDAMARDWYVSISRGKGKKGTKEKPAKDLGNIAKRLKPGDKVHIAEGTYLGKGKNGVDRIEVPVQIIGGYADDFSKRDPWGAHRTILSGDNKSKNYKVGARLELDLSKYKGKEFPTILVDGLIVDQGAQNRYKTDKQHMIVRKANPKTGQNPTPDRGALFIRVSRAADYKSAFKIVVKNNIVMNAAPTQGALTVSGYAGSKVFIINNVVINCTGTGIFAGSSWAGTDEKKAPHFKIVNNTVLFTWKYDAYVQSFSGLSFKTDSAVVAEVYSNVFAYADRYNIQKQGKWPLKLKGNILAGAVEAEYYETSGDAKIKLADLEDEAEYLHEDSEGNGNNKFAAPVSKEWAKLYGSRVLIDRNAVEADIKAQKTRANAIRSMLGLNLQAGAIKADSPIWLPRMATEDAVKVAENHLTGKFGASKALIK